MCIRDRGSSVLLVDESAGVGGGPAGLMYVRVVPPAALQATYGNAVSIAASSSTTVGELKTVISNAIGVSAGSLTVSYGGSVLSNDESSCGGSGVPNGGLIYLTMSGPAPSSPYVVSVTLPIGLQSTHGSGTTLSVSSTSTVSELKALIEEVTGIGVAFQGLYFGGSELSSGSSTLGLSLIHI